MAKKQDWWQKPLPTTETHVQAAERELGITLPGEYRERLMANNGGELVTAGGEWQVFPVLDTTDATTSKRSAGHIVLETRNARAREGFPQGAVALASNGVGDYLILLPGGSPGRLDPQVQVWSHETGKCKPSPLTYD